MTTTPETGHTGDTPTDPRRCPACSGRMTVGHPRPRGRRGEHDHSPRRVRARLRAEQAVRLRADGLTLQQIAEHVDDDGAPLYSSRQRAHEAIKAQLARGTVDAARQLLVPEPATDDLDLTSVAELRNRLATFTALADRGVIALTPEQLSYVAGALLVVDGLTGPPAA